MKNLKYYLMIVAVVVASCKQKENESDKLPIENTVDSLHNEVMVVTEVAFKAKSSLDSVLANRRITKNSDSIAVKKAIENLDQADEKMMDWMHHFIPALKIAESEKVKYYSGQLDTLNQVQHSLKEAIAQANQFLKKMKNQLIFITFASMLLLFCRVKNSEANTGRIIAIDTAHIDLVCNMKLKKPSASSKYKEKEYAFCSKSCKNKFDKTPEKYIKK